MVLYRGATKSVLGPVVFTIFSEELNDEIEAKFIALADKKLWGNVRATKSGIKIQSIYTEIVWRWLEKINKIQRQWFGRNRQL